MVYTLIKISQEQSRYGGFCYLLVFKNNEGRSFKSWLYPKLNNFKKWKEILQFGEGSEISNLKLKSPNIIDADSRPVFIRKVERYTNQGLLF